jgi:hypothetical protein
MRGFDAPFAGGSALVVSTGTQRRASASRKGGRWRRRWQQSWSPTRRMSGSESAAFARSRLRQSLGRGSAQLRGQRSGGGLRRMRGRRAGAEGMGGAATAAEEIDPGLATTAAPPHGSVVSATAAAGSSSPPPPPSSRSPQPPQPPHPAPPTLSLERVGGVEGSDKVRRNWRELHRVTWTCTAADLHALGWPYLRTTSATQLPLTHCPYTDTTSTFPPSLILSHLFTFSVYPTSVTEIEMDVRRTTTGNVSRLFDSIRAKGVDG